MRSYIPLVFAMLLAGNIARAQTTQSFPPTNLALTITCKVDVGTTTSTLTYSYGITNSSTSKQALAQWAIQYDPSLTIAITRSPSGWLTNEAIGGRPLAGWTGLFLPLQSGSTQSGFAIEATGLPGIVQSFAMADIPEDQIPQFPEGEAPESVPGSSILDNNVTTSTVGPVPTPSVFNASRFLDYIISIKEQAATLGWITNSGIKNSLDSKLNAAQKSLMNGNTTAARNQLDALLNEVDAQSGKQLTSQAVALLKFNTQYLISKIP